MAHQVAITTKGLSADNTRVVWQEHYNKIIRVCPVRIHGYSPNKNIIIDRRLNLAKTASFGCNTLYKNCGAKWIKAERMFVWVTMPLSNLSKTFRQYGYHSANKWYRFRWNVPSKHVYGAISIIIEVFGCLSWAVCRCRRFAVHCRWHL